MVAHLPHKQETRFESFVRNQVFAHCFLIPRLSSLRRDPTYLVYGNTSCKNVTFVVM